MNDLANLFDAGDDYDGGDHTRLSAESLHVGFPATLPIELALQTAPLHDLLSAYGITAFEYEALCRNPVFVAAVKHANELAKKDGMSFKLKARMQAEALLTESWSIIHNKEVPPSVRSDLIKATVRWSGLDTPEPIANQQAFPVQININLGG